MISTTKKNLLIFFGELRTFEYIVPHLQRLHDVDIVLSTWIKSTRYENMMEVNEAKIYEIYPNIKQCNIINFNNIENYHLKNNAWKMQYLWKLTIKNLNNLNDYDNVIFHRCDFLSNWHSILDLDIEQDTIYVHYEKYKQPPFPNNLEVFWVNDYYFFGKMDIIKKFVNLFNKETNTSSHFDIWEVISENKLKFKNFILRGALIRDTDIEMITTTKINVSDMGLLIGGGGV